MNKQKAENFLQKKIKDQGNTTTFFDNLIQYGLWESSPIPQEVVLNSWAQLLNSKSNRFSNYEDRSKEKCHISKSERTLLEALYLSQGTHSLIKWKGLDLFKSAFDLVIYWMLISELKPNTIIEYGSGKGGSAVWLADISLAMGHDQIKIFSYDIKPPNVTHPKVDFIGIDLEKDFIEEKQWTGKKLVIEDAHVNIKEVLLKTDLHLKMGDYLIVEDSDTKKSEIVDFLFNAKNTYKTDNFYLDFFGRNTTSNLDSIFKVF
tara:strand:- start:228 stop:1010 length:783 start_codon:yes stop_codon:yes gene_type:complete